jgi:hypothetical protein
MKEIATSHDQKEERKKEIYVTIKVSILNSTVRSILRNDFG